MSTSFAWIHYQFVDLGNCEDKIVNLYLDKIYFRFFFFYRLEHWEWLFLYLVLVMDKIILIICSLIYLSIKQGRVYRKSLFLKASKDIFITSLNVHLRALSHPYHLLHFQRFLKCMSEMDNALKTFDCSTYFLNLLSIFTLWCCGFFVVVTYSICLSVLIMCVFCFAWKTSLRSGR